MEFRVLASGSSGNLSFVRHQGFGLLLDLGLNPRRVETTFRKAGLSWHDINAVALTHTHGDHWNDAGAAELHARGIPLFCHARHADELAAGDASFFDLQEAGLVNLFELDRAFCPADSLLCQAFALSHDAGMTCGFRIEGIHPGGLTTTLGYVSDLGTWNEHLVSRLRDVDLLALEFNHDETMQRESGRPWFLINRVLGSLGHLSNHQAAELFRRVLMKSAPGRPRHLVQLHLSRQCNTPPLAAQSARQVVEEMRRAVTVHTAPAAHPTVCIHLEPSDAGTLEGFRQMMLPGF